MRPTHPRLRRLARPAALAVAVLLTVAATWVLAHEGHAPLPTRGAQVDAATGQIILSRDAREALDVQTTEVESRPVTESLLAYATLTSPWQNHAFASSRVGGRVVKLHAQPGQTVAAGQVLAEVESVELESLQLELLNAQNDARLSEKIVTDLEPSVKVGAVPGQSLLDAEAKLKQNRNALAVAKAKWTGLGLPGPDLDTLLRAGKPQPRTFPVRTPVRGTVVHADLAVGKVVEPLEHLFEVVDLSSVWVRIDVLEQDLHRVEVGQPVEVRLTAYPGDVFRAAVKVKGVFLDPRTHLNAVWAELPNLPGGDPRLLPGMSGEARLLLAGPAATTAVPAGAVVREGAEHYVLVEEAGATGGSEYRRRAVAVGRQAGGWVEVRSGGLFPGDRVVVRGGHELAGLFAQGVLRPSPEAARGIGLEVEPVSLRAVEDVAEIDGAVDLPPARRASASSPLAGTVSKVLVDRGQPVKAGDVLAEVVSLDLHALQLDYLRAHLEGELQEDTYGRLKASGDATSRRKLLEQEALVNAGRQQRDTLRRKLRVAGLTDDRIAAVLKTGTVVEAVPVRSPIDGVAVGFDRTLGQAVKAEEPLFAVHDLTRPVIQGYVSERDLGRVRVGQRVRVRVAGDPAFLAEGTVAGSGRVFGPDSRTLSVWAELDRPPAQPLRHNQLARLTLVLGQPRPALAVPRSALVYEGTRAYAFVRQPDGAFERVPVELGRADDRLVEITRGLNPGDPVAVRGTAELQTAYAGIK
jgi:cobalt-zinc-cadmium efflux system membrane fusion protein